jgi:hypothetical protein
MILNTPTDPVKLFRFAEAIAKRLAEQHEGLRTDEALLRAAIAWTRFARDGHRAALESAKNCPEARVLVDTARKRRIRAEELLRLRLAVVIADLARLAA